MSDKNNQLQKVRHSAEHILTIAMGNLGYKFHMALGPAIDEGFYFDFELLEGSISEEDFPKIEKEMKKVIKQNIPFEHRDLAIKESKEMFDGNPYKIELIDEIVSRGERISAYQTGDFIDLCAGPHVKKTGEVKAIKLLSVAGAYWRGSEKNKMLTRIYGTAFESQKELDEYLVMMEEAKKRDHRKIGAQLDLFHYSEKAGQGLTLWTPNGTIVKDQLEDWAKETEKEWGYVRVSTPHIGKEDLYLTSGHLPYYKDDMYPEMDVEGELYYLKGMNCPHHFEIFNRKQHSYRDLPLRYAEYGMVYRYEMSGTLFGLMRVRAIDQNDAHIFCSEKDAEQEFLDVIKLHEYYYNALGLTRDDYYIVIGLPDESKRDKYHGDVTLWNKAEKMMKSAIKKSGIKCVDDVGGAAFYGPKIDFNIRSAVGREFSISTNQLDLYMPTRFNLQYVNEKGTKENVVVIHRAPLGSHERFIGFLIEHFGGAFPVWLHPNQVQIIPISEKHVDYAHKLAKELSKKDIRFEIDDKDETMGNKIRKAQEQKVPYMLIVGDKEVEAENVSVRYRDGEQENGIDFSDFVKQVEKVINSKSLKLK